MVSELLLLDEMMSHLLDIESLWKKLQGRLVLSALSLLAFGVAGVAAQAGGAAGHPDEEKVKRQKEVESVAAFWIGCQGRCHPSVGSLFRVSVGIKSRQVGKEVHFSTVVETGRCTMSLVGPNRILTNAHCLPEGAKTNDILEGFYAIFPSTPADEPKRVVARPVERIKVARVLEVSAFQSGASVSVSPDFAILELERTVPERPILPIASRPFEEGKIYHVVAMWPLKDYSKHPDPMLRKETPVGALQRKEKCHSLDDTLLLYRPKSAAADYVNLFGCPAPGGNSGSPILNDQGEVLGVLSNGPQRMSVVEGAKDLVETYSASDVYERYRSSLFQPNETPRFWLTGTTSKCILNSSSCRIPITKDDKRFGDEVFHARSAELINATLSRGVSELTAVGPGTAFFSRIEYTDTEAFPRRITAQAAIDCPSAAYFLGLGARLDPAGKGFETNVSYNARKLVIDAGIDRSWRAAVRSEFQDFVETIRVRVSPERIVERVLPGGRTESLGPLCAAE